MKLFSLFTGAGGLDLGLEKAGFSIHGAVEEDIICRSTLTHNRNWKLANKGDIHSYSPKELRREFSLLKGEIDLISAGPPCQPFSKSSYWFNGSSLRMKDPRAHTIRICMDTIEEFLPKSFLIENVTGFIYQKKSEGLTFIRRKINKLNKSYNCNYKLQIFRINAANYGVPQKRERIFLFAAKDGATIILPPPTHFVTQKDFQKYPNSLPCNNAWDAFNNTCIQKYNHKLEITGKWADLLPSIPEGNNYLWHTPKGGGKPLFKWRSKYWSFLLKLAKDKPSWTIQAQPGPATGPFHWDNRKLSIPELLKLQTFPEEYRIEGNYRECLKQIGNAVPSAIGELLGLEISRQVFKQKVRKSLSLIPKKIEQPPNRERIFPVKKVFLATLVN
jgi:DNA (cytosine-5)-methyltransferase 1